MKRTIAILLVFNVFKICFISGQNMTKVEHISGSKKVNGINIDVSSYGGAESLSYCSDETGPYYIGYSNKKYLNETGGYTFKFTPAVESVKLNIAALSTSSSYHEEVIITVNGKHYRIPKAYDKNSCESLALITERGDLAPCEGCSGSGMNNIIIKGPISSLTVENRIIKGEPMGSVFSLFFYGRVNGFVADTVVTDTVSSDTTTTVPEVIFSENNVPVKIKGRDVELQKTITVTQPEFDIEIWDRSVVDGDSISLNLNGEWILNEYMVVKNKKKIHIKINPNFTNNYIILYALNLGSIPPNTAAVQLVVDGRTYRITLNSDLTKSGALNFEYKPDK